jgi:hypothetical protein
MPLHSLARAKHPVRLRAVGGCPAVSSAANRSASESLCFVNCAFPASRLRPALHLLVQPLESGQGHAAFVHVVGLMELVPPIYEMSYSLLSQK